MALRKLKSTEAEWLFGWNPSDYVDDQVTLNQYTLLLQAFEDVLKETGVSGYVAGMTPVRFEHEGKRKELGPDLFVVLDCDPHEREYWVAWEEEGRFPSLIIEFLSPRTERNDRGGKMDLYAQVFKTPEYFLFDPKPEKLRLEAYALVEEHYVRTLPDAHGHVPCSTLGGTIGIHDEKLRLFRPDGTMVPTRLERADEAQQRADLEQRRADVEHQRAEALSQEVERLRRLHGSMDI